jgi:heme/copper-type cytochrome/quinol oxidase subunit 4
VKGYFNRVCMAFAVMVSLTVIAIAVAMICAVWKQVLFAFAIILAVMIFFRGINLLLDGEW